MIKLFLSVLSLLSFSFASYSQFEGVVSYDISYEAVDEAKKEMLSMLPKKSLLYVKGKRSLFEQDVAGGGRQAFFIDAEKGVGVLVMQFLGQGYKIEMSQKQIESLKKAKELDIMSTEERTTIANYSCKKSLAVSDTDTLQVFFATELKTESSVPPFAKVNGIPLKYELIRGGVKITYSALEVKETHVDDSIFDSAPDMKSMEFEDFARSFAISQ